MADREAAVSQVAVQGQGAGVMRRLGRTADREDREEPFVVLALAHRSPQACHTYPSRLRLASPVLPDPDLDPDLDPDPPAAPLTLRTTFIAVHLRGGKKEGPKEPPTFPGRQIGGVRFLPKFAEIMGAWPRPPHPVKACDFDAGSSVDAKE